MKLWIGLFLLVSTGAFGADCAIEPLKQEIISQYQNLLPVRNEKGEIGYARAKNFSVPDYFVKMSSENLLIANFELDIKWLKGTQQTVKTLVVATVNPKTCLIENYERKTTLANSVSHNNR